MVIILVDADADEAQDGAGERGQEGAQGAEAARDGRLQLQHHDRDNDGNHAVTKGSEPFLA